MSTSISFCAQGNLAQDDRKWELFIKHLMKVTKVREIGESG